MSRASCSRAVVPAAFWQGGEVRRFRCDTNLSTWLILACGGGGAGTFTQLRTEFASLPRTEQQQLLNALAGDKEGGDATTLVAERNRADLLRLVDTMPSDMRRGGVGLAARAAAEGERARRRSVIERGHTISSAPAAFAIRMQLDEVSGARRVARCRNCRKFVVGDADVDRCPHCPLAGAPAAGMLARAKDEPNEYGEVKVGGRKLLPQDIAAVVSAARVPDEESGSMARYYANYLAGLTGRSVKVLFGDGSYTRWEDDGSLTVQVDPYAITREEAARAGLLKAGESLLGGRAAELREELEAKAIEVSAAMDVVEAIANATHEAAHILFSTRTATEAVFAFAGAARGRVRGLDGRVVTMAGFIRQLSSADPFLAARVRPWLEQPVDPEPTGRYAATKRPALAAIANCLADGHDEGSHLPGDYTRLAASHALHEVWHFDPDRDSDWQQVLGAILYEALPAKRVPLEQLKPHVRQLFEEKLQGLVRKAADGSSSDVAEASFRLYDILGEAGVLDQEIARASLGGAPAFAKGEGNHSCDSVVGGAEAGKGGKGDTAAKAGQAGDASESDEEGDGEGAGSKRGAASDGRGEAGGASSGDQSATHATPGGAPRDKSARPGGGDEDGDSGTGDEQDTKLGDALSEAGAALRAAAAAEEAAAGDQISLSDFRYEGPHKSKHTAAWFASRAARCAPIAARFAAQIRRLRSEVQRPKRFQDEGRLDRGRLVAAAGGSRDVYVNPGRKFDLDMAAVLCADTSGSMSENSEGYDDDGNRLYSGYNKLADAVTVCHMAFSQAGVADEVYSFDDTLQVHKSFAQREAAGLENVYRITSGGSNAADGNAIRMAAKRLAKRGERNKVIYVATDGVPDYPDEVRSAVVAARRRGITVFGIFMVNDSNRHWGTAAIRRNMSRFYDQAFAIVDKVEDLPELVGGQLIQEIKRKLM